MEEGQAPLDESTFSRHIIPMASSNDVYAQLQHFLRELYQILEAAIALAVEDCNGRARPVDDSFIAAYVRDETKGRLRELQGTPLACEVKALNNGGVQVIYNGYALRVRKEKDGGLPLGQSEALRLYYEQYSLELVWPNDEEPATSADLNLVVLWDFDRATGSLSGVDLVLPHQWRLAIPHPATAILPGTTEVDYDDIDIDFAADDDIALEDHNGEEEEDGEEEAAE
jgi:hypothetical protein